MHIELPWPDPVLSPNAREHWSAKAKAAKKMRKYSWGVTKAAIGRCVPVAPVRMVVTFCPPDHRRRDRDNMIASLKSGMDGIADGLGVDDSHFIPTYQVCAPTKGGAVIVEITSECLIPYKGTI